MFKVGDKVRRVSGTNSTTPKGFEGVIREIRRDQDDDYEYRFDDGAWGYAMTLGVARWELVAPTGPVVTETVTKTRIVPGVYDRMRVDNTGKTGEVVIGLVHKDRVVSPFMTVLTADELDAAAAILSALAKGLRDA